MKVRELLEHIKQYRKTEGNGILDWTVALEQHPDYKKCANCNKPKDYLILNDYDGKTLFIKSHAIGCVRFIKDKVLGIQIHY